MNTLRLFPFAGLCVVLLASCGAHSPNSADEAAPATAASETFMTANREGADSVAEVTGGAPQGKSAVGAPAQTVSQTQRKIIYTATVDLVVENLSAGQTKLTDLVKANGGYIAETNVGGASGSQRTGTWKVRVPVDKYEAFMAGAARLGELQNINSSSQDVTAEYYDVAAHIKNKQVEEARLQDLLQKATGKLSEVLQVEKELSRVRGEIEGLQGRIRVLTNLSSLTTITITMREIKDYVPPAPPTFGTQIARQFNGSLGGVRDFGKGVILFVVALAPWLPVLALIGFPIWRIWKRKKGR